MILTLGTNENKKLISSFLIMTDVLFVWPPKVDDNISVFRHVVHMGETATYVKRAGYEVEVMDGSATKYSLHNFMFAFGKKKRIIAIHTEPHNIESALITGEMSRDIEPGNRTIFYGTAVCMNPNFFMKNGADAACNGRGEHSNWEYGITSYAEYVSCNGEPTDIIYKDGDHISVARRSEPIPPDEWSFPDLALLPMEDYRRAHHENEARINVSRGCRFGCNYCKAKYNQGSKERYRKLDDVMNYLRSIKEYFDCFSITSTNIAGNMEWAFSMCKEVKKENIRWNTVIRMDDLDDTLIDMAAESGCYKMIFGAETLVPEEQKQIGRSYDEYSMKKKVFYMKSRGITPRACIMVGIPGQTKDGIIYTMTRLREWGASVRPKEFYPYHELTNPNLDMETVRKFDRTKYYQRPIPDLSKEEFVRLIFLGEIPKSTI